MASTLLQGASEEQFLRGKEFFIPSLLGKCYFCALALGPLLRDNSDALGRSRIVSHVHNYKLC